MRMISWARGRGLTSYRPPERVEHLYHADRADKIWTEDNVAAFMALAPVTLQRALVLALETGQRQGDLLVLPWSAFDGTWIRLRQSKTGRKVSVPATRRLRAVLDTMPRTSPVMLTNSYGRPWQPNAFRKAWGGVSRKAGIVDLTFHDLRGTAVCGSSLGSPRQARYSNVRALHRGGPFVAARTFSRLLSDSRVAGQIKP